MSNDPSTFSHTPPSIPSTPLYVTEDGVVFECYCGLGPACPAWGNMNATQRAACSADKRQNAQRMYVNGMVE